MQQNNSYAPLLTVQTDSSLMCQISYQPDNSQLVNLLIVGLEVRILTNERDLTFDDAMIAINNHIHNDYEGRFNL